MIRFLFLSVILIGLGCAPSRPALQPASADITCIKKFVPDFNSEWYNTSVDVVGKHLSGLLLIKKMEDQSHRIVFTNESGVKFFDFGFEVSGEFKVYQVLKKINKKVIINTFKKDFELMLMNKVKTDDPVAYKTESGLNFNFDEGKEADYVITNSDCSQLLRLEKWGRKNKMVEILFTGQSSIPDSIQIQHFNFDMTIKMRRLIK